MNKGLGDFDYDTVAEMINNISATVDKLDDIRKTLRDIRFLLVVMLCVVIFSLFGM